MELTKTVARRLNKAKFELFSFMTKRMCSFGYEEIASLLLIGNETSDLMYDYGILIKEQISAGESAESTILQLVTKIHLYDFFLVYRKFACGCAGMDSEAYTYYLWLFDLVLELKVGYCVVGFNSSTGEVFIDDTIPTVMESLMVLIPEFEERMHPAILLSNSKKLPQYVAMKYGYDIKNRMLEKTGIAPTLLRESILESFEHVLLQQIAVSGVVVVPTLLFKESYTPQSWLELMSWERETAAGEQADALLLVLDTLNAVFEKKNIFRDRQKLLSEDGIILELIEPVDGVKEIHLAEIHNEVKEEHFLIITYNCSGSERTLPISLTGACTPSRLALYQVDFTMLMLVMEWLGVRDELLCMMRGMSDKQLFDLTEAQNTTDLNNAREFIEDAVMAVPASVLDDVRYLKPKHWNYEGTTKFNQKQKSSRKSTDYCWELRKIGAHVRRLGKGQHASADREAVAKKYCLDLKPGYTLVEGYVRKQRVKEFSSPKVEKVIQCNFFS